MEPSMKLKSGGQEKLSMLWIMKNTAKIMDWLLMK